MVMEGSDFVEYLEIQENLDFLTKSELLESVRARGRSISDRQLTSLVSEGLVPKSARIGSRAGAYPAIIAELVVWIVDARKQGLSVEAIRELVPLWKFMQRAARQGEVNLGEFEILAREVVRTREAAFAVPMVFLGELPCPIHEADEMNDIKFVHKDGEVVSCTGPSPVTIGFVVADQDEETGEPFRVSSVRVAIPRPHEEHEPSTVVVGLRPGIQFPEERAVETEVRGAGGEPASEVDERG